MYKYPTTMRTPQRAIQEFPGARVCSSGLEHLPKHVQGPGFDPLHQKGKVKEKATPQETHVSF